MSGVFHLVYFSRAAEDLSYTDIREILEASRRNNTQLGITGLLIFRDGYFLQLLEGAENNVRDILSKIRDDDRNYSVRVMIETESVDRLFEGWSMAFYDGDISTNSTAHLVDLFEAVLEGGMNKKNLIMPILRKFRASAPDLK
ncbi:BLUF domain-containing protein [Bdellovibrio bacteriovorus]|uniref:BLUF domain-containing protein n=1 Tax=Bdellovibrio bacteriovorus TaxID=959 RepID=UPI0021CFD199|nr:BLUF domain-containing protein [Bdellovibrio bacteriovorus]UXR64734.1 BLUF domain-containing protein [Bdellovibrio bacteriovorus]